MRNDSDNKPLNYAPWEKSFKKIVTPFEEFIHHESTSGLLLMGCAVLALIMANSAYAETYLHLIHTPVGFSLGGMVLEKSLQHWINDGLMALFFFVVGLEIKREVLVGELSDPRQATLPIAAAIGGMVVPALLYYGLNEGEAAMGWGIPMATDIAFAVGILVLLGKRAPPALMTFLVALAIVDDLGAVIVIALFYTEQITWEALAMAGGLLVLLVVFNRAGVRAPLPYFIVGLLLWLAMLKSGVHATLAGVITALTIPSWTKYDTHRFSEHVRELIDRFDANYREGKSIIENDAQRSILQTLENGVHNVESPLQRLEHSMHLPVAFIIIPLFAFANAGIAIDFSSLGSTLAHPVALSVMLGLIVGKFIGIAGVCGLMLKSGLGQLPAGTSFSQLCGVSLLAGIGFTMSIFIAELAFTGQTENLLMAKTGILMASLLAGIGGYLWLRMCKSPGL